MEASLRAEKDLNCLLKVKTENRYFHPQMTLIGRSSQFHWRNMSLTLTDRITH